MTFDVDVAISTVTNLSGWEFKLFFKNAILSCENLIEGLFLKSGGAETFLVLQINNAYNSTHGRILAGCTILGPNAVSGSGVLATVEFKALAEGNTPLHLTDTKLNDEKIPRQPISHTASDGIVYVGATYRDLAIAGITRSKTVVGKGFDVSIDVEVRNKGNSPETFDVSLNRSWAKVRFSLIGRSATGWNNTTPGPTIAVNINDTLSLRLTSADSENHKFFVDYDGNHLVSPGEPSSANFSGTMTFEFLASSAGTFNYYCLYNQATMFGAIIVNPLATSNLIGIQIVSPPLALDETRAVTFFWDTSLVPRGTYSLIAHAQSLPGEANTADNTLADGWVVVTIPGDIDGNFKVNLSDLVLLAQAYGSKPDEPKWNPNVDIDSNGIVGLSDLVVLASNYGKTDS
jgi:hypothetical protein